jgi:hypothetical protein
MNGPMSFGPSDLERNEAVSSNQWSGHAPDLVRDNRLIHERLAEQDREIARLTELLRIAESKAIPVETDDDPTLDPANAEIVSKLKAAFAADPDQHIVGSAMRKLADGAMAPNGVAILTTRECDAMGKEIRRLVRLARGESSEGGSHG